MIFYEILQIFTVPFDISELLVMSESLVRKTLGEEVIIHSVAFDEAKQEALGHYPVYSADIGFQPTVFYVRTLPSTGYSFVDFQHEQQKRPYKCC